MSVPHAARSIDTADPLVARVTAGDGEALGVLYDRYAARLLRVAWRLVGTREDAEDVLHDLFVGLPEALRRYHDRGRLEGWLVQCTARVALMRLRARRRRPERALTDADDGIAASRPDLAPELRELEARIARLPDPLRAVFVLRQIEGCTHDEIAATLGISVGNSRVRLSRAFAALGVTDSGLEP
ncbi:MAG: sigma-70 family RNA polymerase sigma factor [Gemmatimonadetes bacterium]|nr:sigma-70 family RNA polymerase sigma factor [Gemmatimonadota bacterium]